ncbi:hypothetical protein P3S67_015462 [Capsicum chacoense]
MKMKRLLLLHSCFLLSTCLRKVMSHSFHNPIINIFSDERLALLQFKHQFSSTGSSYVSTCHAAYSKTSLWNESSSDYCIWDGVTCHDSTGHVIGLDLNAASFMAHLIRIAAFFNFIIFVCSTLLSIISQSST